MKRDVTVIIAEGQEWIRKTLENYVNELDLKIMSSVGSAQWLIDDCIKYQPDVLFLDLGLHDFDGLSAYKKILDKGISPLLVMVSGMVDESLIESAKAMNNIEVMMNIIDFITIPLSIDRLSATVVKLKSRMEKDLFYNSSASPVRIIQLKSGYRTIYINENQLIYALKVKNENKTVVYLDGEKEIITTTCLSEIISQCSENIFSPNQSNLVNLNYIHSVTPSDMCTGTYVIKMNYNGIEIDLTRRKRREFEQRYTVHKLSS